MRTPDPDSVPDPDPDSDPDPDADPDPDSDPDPDPDSDPDPDADPDPDSDSVPDPDSYPDPARRTPARNFRFSPRASMIGPRERRTARAASRSLRDAMGFLYNLPFVVLVSVGAALYVASRRTRQPSGVAAELACSAEPITRPLFSFFGLPPRPPLPVVGIGASVAGGSGLLLGALGRAAFEGATFLLAANTFATSLALGLLAAKLAYVRGERSARVDWEREKA